jgi:hypothetical protein
VPWSSCMVPPQRCDGWCSGRHNEFTKA